MKHLSALDSCAAPNRNRPHVGFCINCHYEVLDSRDMERMEVDWDIATEVAKASGTDQRAASKVIALIDGGNTLPFIARYRKEVTGNMEPDSIRRIKAKLAACRCARQPPVLETTGCPSSEPASFANATRSKAKRPTPPNFARDLKKFEKYFNFSKRIDHVAPHQVTSHEKISCILYHRKQ
ncbi:unnamed protein product [Schistocephalus solidus]|uniref:Tex_N domain-containing protein n=1 Tax=Schistocephalus solidus TaxID=70667 RepID=A0A183TP30_SCHSO|nr:unnamed protein product [Schistocephalus solidus]